MKRPGMICRAHFLFSDYRQDSRFLTVRQLLILPENRSDAQRLLLLNHAGQIVAEKFAKHFVPGNQSARDLLLSARALMDFEHKHVDGPRTVRGDRRLVREAFFSVHVERYGLSKLAPAMPPLEAFSDLFYP